MHLSLSTFPALEALNQVRRLPDCVFFLHGMLVGGHEAGARVFEDGGVRWLKSPSGLRVRAPTISRPPPTIHSSPHRIQSSFPACLLIFVASFDLQGFGAPK